MTTSHHLVLYAANGLSMLWPHLQRTRASLAGVKARLVEQRAQAAQRMHQHAQGLDSPSHMAQRQGPQPGALLRSMQWWTPL